MTTYVICNSHNNVIVLQLTGSSCMELFDVIVSRAQYGDDNCVLIIIIFIRHKSYDSIINRYNIIHIKGLNASNAN